MGLVARACPAWLLSSPFNLSITGEDSWPPSTEPGRRRWLPFLSVFDPLTNDPGERGALSWTLLSCLSTTFARATTLLFPSVGPSFLPSVVGREPPPLTR
jgi:hypothetical protein